MNRFVRIASAMGLGVSMTTLVACGGTAKTTLQFSKSSATAVSVEGAEPLANTGTATPAGLKLLLNSAYLSEDIDANYNNTGATEDIWMHSSCSEHPCNLSLDKKSDFTDPTAINTELNSQGREVHAGTYRYVRLEFCNATDAGQTTEQNAEVTTGAGETYQVRTNQCTVSSVKMDPPLEIEDGQEVVITLAYTLENSITADAGAADASVLSCADGTGGDAGKAICYQGIEFTPSAAVK